LIHVSALRLFHFGVEKFLFFIGQSDNKLFVSCSVFHDFSSLVSKYLGVLGFALTSKIDKKRSSPDWFCFINFPPFGYPKAVLATKVWFVD
jgi:hypothetical protein